MNSKAIKRAVQASPLFCLLILGWLSHQDGNETVRQSYIIIDRLMHFDIELEYMFFRDMMHLVAFFGVGFTVYAAVNHVAPPKIKSFMATIILIPVVAFLDEFHQSFVPGRTPSFYDFKLDLIGGLVGLLSGMLVCLLVYQVLHFYRYKNNPVH